MKTKEALAKLVQEKFRDLKKGELKEILRSFNRVKNKHKIREKK
jgi:hypothetical protein